ncbi:MAG: protein translocase subunit SecF [Candidatus Cloacimonetes bacterium]|nr:protein translocase subunit SecF [Candidatus Cloacimonadota bacterium]
MRLFADTNYDFMSKRKLAYVIAGIIILVGWTSVIINGGISYHVDFTGGLSLEIAPIPVNNEYLSVHQVRDALSRHGFHDTEIQELPRTNSFLIKTKLDEQVGDQVIQVLRDEFPEHTNISDDELIRSREEVGPRAGAELRSKAINAVLISILFILIYIWIRFRFAWGFVASFALLFDTMATIGILSLFKVEMGMTVVAGLLTIVGYSINNTIVYFDRIRENLKLYRKDDESVIINKSINDTLGRSIILSFTTLLACMSLIAFGGPVIFDFAFTFTVGVVIGTFSSMCLATGLVLDTVIALKKNKLAPKKK